MRPLRPLILTRLLARPSHRAFSLSTPNLKSKMPPPPPPPNPPLSYRTSPKLNPFLVPYHPTPSSSTADLVTHRLAVGAAVLLNGAAAPAPKILVLRRSALEKALPHRWELPGGAAEAVDGNLVASATRELWEETGLRASHVRGLVGSYWWAGFGPSLDAAVVPGDQAWALPGGGVGMASPDLLSGGGGGVKTDGGDGRSPQAAKGRDAWRKFTYLVEVEPADGEDEVKVVIDPEEHDEFVWATEEEVRADRAGEVELEWTSVHQKQDILKAFEMAKKM